MEFESQTLRVGTNDAGAIQPLLDAVRRQGLVIRRLQPYRQSLEDLFMEAVTDPATGQAMTPGADRRQGFEVGAAPIARVAPSLPPAAVALSDAPPGQLDSGGQR